MPGRAKEIAADAMDIKGVLWDIDEWLRSNVKYGSEFDEKTLEAVRAHFHECLEQRNVRLHEYVFACAPGASFRIGLLDDVAVAARVEHDSQVMPARTIGPTTWEMTSPVCNRNMSCAIRQRAMKPAADSRDEKTGEQP